MNSTPSRDPLQQVGFDVRVTALATEVLQPRKVISSIRLALEVLSY